VGATIYTSTVATAEHFLDRYLDPIAEVLTPPVAQRILDLKAVPDVLKRVAELGQKSNHGTLTEEELDEYRVLADAGTLISILKNKARRTLSKHSS
jgi:hypothetical protein